jgi:hypothetical protein
MEMDSNQANLVQKQQEIEKKAQEIFKEILAKYKLMIDEIR